MPACIVICTAAVLTDVNLVWEAMGRGPGNLSRKLTTNPSPTWETPATHYFMNDASATPEDVAAWQAMTLGTLPTLQEWVIWGEDGVISEADAIAATDGANMQVFSAAGDISANAHLAGIMSGSYTPPLKEVPFPPA